MSRQKSDRRNAAEHTRLRFDSREAGARDWTYHMPRDGRAGELAHMVKLRDILHVLGKRNEPFATESPESRSRPRTDENRWIWPNLSSLLSWKASLTYGWELQTSMPAVPLNRPPTDSWA